MRRALVLLALAASILGGPARAAAHECSITADPAPAWPGANVSLRGQGFTIRADITVSLGFFPVYDGFVGDYGVFQIAFRVPDPFELGPVELTVIDHTGGCDATLAYEIGDPPPRDPPVAPWGLAVFALVGAALGIGVAGVLLRRR